MRIGSQYFSESLANQLSSISSKQSRLQNQASSGQRLQWGDEDPDALRKLMSLQAEGQSAAQHKSNISALQEKAAAVYQGLNGLKTISNRAGEIATLADGTKSKDDLKAYAVELDQLIQQGVQTVNAQYQGQYIFAGTKSAQSPFVSTTDANGNVTGVAYRGNADVPASEVDTGATLSVLVPGANDTGAGAHGVITDTRAGADFFNHLIALRDHLQAGNLTAIKDTDRAALQKDEANIIYHIGNNGNIQSRLETAASLLTKKTQTVASSVSDLASADLATTLVQLSQTQVAYQAAMQSGAKLLSSSLLDYLH